MAEEMYDLQRRRLLFVSALLVGFGFVMSYRIYDWQVQNHDRLRERAQKAPGKQDRMIPPRRGVIHDREGRLLAASVRSDEVKASPDGFNGRTDEEEKQKEVEKVAQTLGLSREEILAKLVTQGLYVRLKKDVPVSQVKALMDDKIPWINYDAGTRRVYPNGALLSHTLGFLNADGVGTGLEGSFNAVLTGVAGTMHMEEATYGASPGYRPARVDPVQHGANLYLTVDLYIQYTAERELERALAAERATSGSVVIMNPRTGELLALACRPTFDPNKFIDVAPQTYTNQVVSGAWEPGSIFKILTIGAALDAKVITPQRTFPDRGTMRYNNIIIRNRGNKAYGDITPAQILQHSSNVGTVQIADLLGTDKFYDYVRKFGIGRLTEIELPAESKGMLRVPDESLWHVVDLATHSYGQGLSATPLQMTTAVAAVANNGVYMRPYVVRRIQGPGRDEERTSGLARPVVSPETARVLTEMLVFALDNGTPQARVPGYRLAGKTGTAEIPTATGYDPDDTIASFIGYGPAEDPQFVILVRIDRPQVHRSGADAAGPVFRNIAQWLLTYLKIPPTDQRAMRQ